ncbi:MAG: YdeI/OmpD-associated family protein [Bacteroidota bacterium]|nr:YdeI/OmpD-associated family protein [Bacteroidota bacterium]MDP4228877.1 YdeI/OmpD-associated family protein [Bacteroidota bacterium]MDP4234958.1 YdeI/OmpD-associated family protein [Bacteroidota bacterium]
MSNRNPNIDAYITKAQPFAKPILQHIRGLVHKACPDVEEKIRWGFPHFDHCGQMMCSMAAFKHHAVMGFPKAELMKDEKLRENARSESAMGHMGRLSNIKDLPSDRVIIAYIKEAMKLNEAGIKLSRTSKSKTQSELPLPDSLKAALKKNKKAMIVFDKFPPSHRKEYVLWITEAKTDETRQKRLDQALEWIAEGKPWNWKYMRK